MGTLRSDLFLTLMIAVGLGIITIAMVFVGVF